MALRARAGPLWLRRVAALKMCAPRNPRSRSSWAAVGGGSGSPFDMVVKGGTVCTATDSFKGDVGIVDGIVTAVATSLPTDDSVEVVDATGKLVLPGGVDSHAHIEQTRTLGGPLSVGELFDTGGRSAMCGGTTTTISFCQQMEGLPLSAAIEDYEAKATKATADYGFHLIINDPTREVLAELPELIAQGHRSIKVFMTYSHNKVGDQDLLRIMEVARQEGAIITLHCENHDAIAWMTEKLTGQGLTRPLHHTWAKPSVVEREAVCRAIALAELTDCPIQIFHVTAGEVADEIARAQHRGVKVWAETCTHYLSISDKDLDRPGLEGAKYICSPAPRHPSEHEALWRHIRSGTIGNITSDHAPTYFHGRREGEFGKLDAGPDARFDQITNGMPGLETRMPVLFHLGVNSGRLTINDFVALTATNAAKLFGIYPQKGTIAPGSDADLAVWDPNWKTTIRQEHLHHHADYTPYEGLEVTGWPTTTIARGQIVATAQRGVTDAAVAGRGRWLPRDRYDHIRPSGNFPTPCNPYA